MGPGLGGGLILGLNIDPLSPGENLVFHTLNLAATGWRARVYWCASDAPLYGALVWYGALVQSFVGTGGD